jgi:hypothetical protein
MRIEPERDHFIIMDGREYSERYFCFFVDDTRSSWTKTKPWTCAQFHGRELAIVALQELRLRGAKRRKEMTPGGCCE